MIILFIFALMLTGTGIVSGISTSLSVGSLIMINLLIVLSFITAQYKPIHVLQTTGLSCGVSDRLLKEKVKVYFNLREDEAIVNHTNWSIVMPLDSTDPELLDISGIIDPTWGWAVHYQAQPNSYMTMDLLFSTDDAYLSIQGIDAQRRPCKDAVYLKRVR